MLFKVALGYAIRTERMHQGLNLRDLSSKSFMALGYLSEVERGMKDASSEVIDMISKGLGIPTSELLRHTCEVMSDWEQQEKEKTWDLLQTKTLTN